jgi:hypothetical protein
MHLSCSLIQTWKHMWWGVVPRVQRQTRHACLRNHATQPARLPKYKIPGTREGGRAQHRALIKSNSNLYRAKTARIADSSSVVAYNVVALAIAQHTCQPGKPDPRVVPKANSATELGHHYPGLAATWRAHTAHYHHSDWCISKQRHHASQRTSVSHSDFHCAKAMCSSVRQCALARAMGKAGRWDHIECNHFPSYEGSLP